MGTEEEEGKGRGWYLDAPSGEYQIHREREREVDFFLLRSERWSCVEEEERNKRT